MNLNDPPIPVGKRLRLLSMPSDPDPIPAGATGTVTGGHGQPGDPLAQVWVRWDPPHEARSLCLLPGTDRFQLIGDDE